MDGARAAADIARNAHLSRLSASARLKLPCFAIARLQEVPVLEANDLSPTPFYLTGNFAPVMDEITAFDLPVQGEIPAALRGVYMRNGANPAAGDPGHWFLGDGMLHGIRLEEGKAQWYRNRFVRTRALDEGAEFLGKDGSIDLTAGKANTNIIAHAGRVLALVENAFPTEVTRDLGTIGVCDFDGALKTAMTAHPKLCPTTGELHFFGYTFMPPFLTYHVLDAAGRLVKSEAIEVRGPTMMHDFALTERHAVFMDLPVVFDIERAMAGEMPYTWSRDYGARLGILPRGGRSADVRWVEIEPCYVFHPANAFEADGKLVVDVARYPHMWAAGSEDFPSAVLHRWEVDLDSGAVAETALDDRPIEFPRVDDRRGGLRHRYSYAVSSFNVAGSETANLVKYDMQTGRAEVHTFGDGCLPGEAVFVPATAAAGEDEGCVLAFVYDRKRDGSDFVILDAANFKAAPLARVELPRRVPFGFHGNWIADEV